MLKKTITYTDFDGKQQTDDFYFHFSKTELIELGLTYEGGLDEALMRMIRSKDHATLMREIKRILLLSYGERSADGKRFLKSDEIRANFENHAAFDDFFLEFLQGEDPIIAFLKAVIPSDMRIDVDDLKTKMVDIPAPDQRPNTDLIPGAQLPAAPLPPPPLPQR